MYVIFLHVAEKQVDISALLDVDRVLDLVSYLLARSFKLSFSWLCCTCDLSQPLNKRKEYLRIFVFMGDYFSGLC